MEWSAPAAAAASSRTLATSFSRNAAGGLAFDIFTMASPSNTVLVIDESGIPKKGENSVGVSRQYCGQTGKVDNCQVGVYASLVRGDKATLIDARLFLPERWTSDAKRCDKAGVPPEERRFRTKHEIALEIVQNALEVGVRFSYIAFDGFYGSNGELLRTLGAAGLRFVADVHKDQLMFTEDPLTIRKGSVEALRVDEWVAAQPHQAWRRVTIRKGTKGPIEIELLHRRVWFWKKTEAQSYCWHLIVRREIESKDEIKYTLSNAAPDVPRQQLAYLQGQRYWVERCLQEAKQQAGMADYQVRGWLGWHHHMAMVLMAMLFMLEERIESGDDLPITCSESNGCSNRCCRRAVAQRTRFLSFWKSVCANAVLPSQLAHRPIECDKVELITFNS